MHRNRFFGAVLEMPVHRHRSQVRFPTLHVTPLPSLAAEALQKFVALFGKTGSLVATSRLGNEKSEIQRNLVLRKAENQQQKPGGSFGGPSDRREQRIRQC